MAGINLAASSTSYVPADPAGAAVTTSLRVLFTAVPIHGHLLPLLPLARAVAAADDHPVLAVPASMSQLVDDLPVCVHGPDIDLLLAENARRTGGAPMTDYDAVAELFAATRIDLTYGEALRHAHQNRPDLIVADEYDTIGPMLASALDVPLVQHAIGLPVSPPQLATAMHARLATRYQLHRLSPPDRIALVDPWPEILPHPQWKRSPDRLAIRPQPYGAATDTAPHPPKPARQRPRVLVTLGTVILDRDLLDAIVDAIATLGIVDVLALIPPGVAHPLADTRGHVQFQQFTPIAQLLDDVAVVVAAGGAGTVLAALGRSIPMVLLPRGAEKPMTAERITAAMAGITITEPGQAGDAVAAALADPSYAAAARHIANQITAAPEPDQVWAALRERLGF